MEKPKHKYRIVRIKKPCLWRIYVLYRNGKHIHRTHYWKEKEDCKWFLENIEKTGTYDYNNTIIWGKFIYDYGRVY